MELNGHLRSFELVDLLQMIGLGRNTGTLLVRGVDEWVALVIYGGRLERVLSQSISYESFGELLIESGLFDAETLDDILTLQQDFQTPRRLGEILKDYGINKHCIKEALFSQIRSLITELLGLKFGTFSLHLNRVPAETLPAGVRQIQLDEPLEVMDLLLWATQELDELYMKTCQIDSTINTITQIEPSELENLVERLAYADEAVIESRESNRRFQLSLTRAFWAELRSCQTQQEVLVLLLRAAGSVAGRGLVVQVDHKELYNLGSYNRMANSKHQAEEVEFNEDMISVETQWLHSSILGCALNAGQTMVTNWPENPESNIVNRWLMSRLGAKMNPGTRAFMIPIESEGGTLILYGDNACGQIDFDQLAELEVMLTQVALTLERLRLIHTRSFTYCPAA